MMGSGGMIVMDEDDCMVSVARFYLDLQWKSPAGNAHLAALETNVCWNY